MGTRYTCCRIILVPVYLSNLVTSTVEHVINAPSGVSDFHIKNCYFKQISFVSFRIEIRLFSFTSGKIWISVSFATQFLEKKTASPTVIKVMVVYIMGVLLQKIQYLFMFFLLGKKCVVSNIILIWDFHDFSQFVPGIEKKVILVYVLWKPHILLCARIL